MAEAASIACAENIALLHILHKIPTPPLVNAIPPTSIHAAGYTLPFATERLLAGALAFLSSITDSSHCITAVCVQEQREDEKLNVYVAINKEIPKANDATLHIICDGFGQIFARLSRPGDGNCENDIFVKIISLCKSRILSRLGYEKKSASKSSRNPLDKALERARKSLMQLQSGIQVPKMERYRQKASSLSAATSQFLDKSADVLRLLGSWIQHKTDHELCVVIDSLCDFVSVDQWKAVVDLIPDQLMEPSLRQSLVAMLRKCARYRHVARILYRTAKKMPLARRMEAVPIHLADSAFQQSSVPATPASLDATLSRTVANRKHGVGRICRALKINGERARDAFDAQASKTLAEGRLHAEVQLLSHILTHPSLNPPRVVSASKDACFLCQCLLQAHAKLHTPRSHGRLYPGWRLPPTAEFQPLQAALNRILEQQIQRSVAVLVNGGARRRMVYPDPCESSCSTAILSDTTVASEGSDPASDATSVDRNADAPVVEDILVSSKPSSATSNTVSVACNLDTPGAADMLASLETSASPSGNAASRRADDAPPAKSIDDDWTLRQSYALAQGEVVASHLPTNKTSRMYTADALQVQLEYTKTERRAIAEETTHLHYQIQQLTAREASTLRESGFVPIMDVSAIEVGQEQTCKLHKLTDLYLGAGDCIFRLVLQPAAQA